MEFPDLKSVYKGEDEEAGGIRISFGKEDSTDESPTAPEPQEKPPVENNVSEEKANNTVYLPESRGMSKVPTIATESELRRVESMRRAVKQRRLDMDPRKARALRRKLYLDLYRDAASKGFI